MRDTWTNNEYFSYFEIAYQVNSNFISLDCKIFNQFVIHQGIHRFFVIFIVMVGQDVCKYCPSMSMLLSYEVQERAVNLKRDTAFGKTDIQQLIQQFGILWSLYLSKQQCKYTLLL